MKHISISLSNEEIKSLSPYSVYDNKLRNALNGEEKYILLYLHPNLGCGTELLEWLEKWQIKFSSQKKYFIIVPGNVNQFECLEVSHPDQELKYFPNQEKVNDFLDSLIKSTNNISEEKANTKQEITQQKPEQIESKDEKKQELIPDSKEEIYKNPIHLEIGSLVEISGEYVCLSCKTTRMWLKGDITTECNNAECSKPDMGWEMTFELF
jgi:hypothetical protein